MNSQDVLAQFEQGFRSAFSLTDEEWQAFVETGVLRYITKGETLFEAGDVVDKVRFVCAGTLCNFYLTPDGTRRNKSFLQRADVSACLSSFSKGLSARFSCEALTDAVCFEVSAKALKVLSEGMPGWKNAFLQMVTALALKKEAREADLLLLSPTELYVQFVETQPELAESLPNYHIASYLGITEVSLSRIRAKLGVQNHYHRA
ncbi:Crp/Fnr family transcriptional regulator [Enterovibrio sp. ZSDZ35]|uniref:Crp/Fnr family transcriptional regulator n=1 Tax=Enterovibrio qingdaonensis TaxID=2899818 RepID=A0ABT5QJ95_9GAMM|nr:Crp/Fnr family transcriptional regulator [Enterovibrio sp. ZSDZ35]MDD1780934.1 Crp/Fnr family transcriptional regulator [Enterovibrio sp. ZSDZ35]